jgi:hypothetical protein
MNANSTYTHAHAHAHAHIQRGNKARTHTPHAAVLLVPNQTQCNPTGTGAVARKRTYVHTSWLAGWLAGWLVGWLAPVSVYHGLQYHLQIRSAVREAWKGGRGGWCGVCAAECLLDGRMAALEVGCCVARGEGRGGERVLRRWACEDGASIGLQTGVRDDGRRWCMFFPSVWDMVMDMDMVRA